MRYRVRGIMNGTNVPVLHKIDAANPYEAATLAARQFVADGYDPSQIGAVSIKPMKASKTKATYFGKPTTGRKGPIGRREPAATTADVGAAIKANASTPAPAAPATPATKPAAKPGK